MNDNVAKAVTEVQIALTVNNNRSNNNQ